MHGEGFFYQAFVYLAAAVLSVPLAKRLGLGSVLGYLIAGIVIGPFGLALVGEEGQDVLHFPNQRGHDVVSHRAGASAVTAVAHADLDPRSRGSAGRITALVIAAASLGIGLDLRSSLAIGLVLSLSSTAIVLQTLQERDLMKTAGGKSSFSVLLFQDIAVIPMLALLPLLAHGAGMSSGGHGGGGHGTTSVEGLPGWGAALAVAAAVAVIVVGGKCLVRPAFRFIARAHVPEIFTAAALLLVIGIALLMSKVELSPALGTFLAGVVLATSQYRHELEGDIAPFKALLLGLFFIAVGASIDFAVIMANPGLIIGLVAALIVVKFVILFVLGRVFRNRPATRTCCLPLPLRRAANLPSCCSRSPHNKGCSHWQRRRRWLSSSRTDHGADSAADAGQRAADPAPTRDLGDRPERAGQKMDESHPVIIAGYGRFGTIIGRMLRANGIDVTVLDLDSDHVEMLRSLGQKVFYGDASRLDLLRAAGAETARV